MEGTPKPLGHKGFLDARLSGEPPRRDELCFEKWWRACRVHATHALLAPIYAIHLFSESYNRQRLVVRVLSADVFFIQISPKDFRTWVRFPLPVKSAASPTWATRISGSSFWTLFTLVLTARRS